MWIGISHLLLIGVLIPKTSVGDGSVDPLRHIVLLLLVLRPGHVVEALRHSRHIVLLLLVLRPGHVVEALEHLLWHALGLLMMMMLVTLERPLSSLFWDVALVLHLGIAPGNAEPAVVDGDALHLAHGHQGVATHRVLNESAGLVGPVHIGDLAELLKEFLKLLISHPFVDAADEQGRVFQHGGVFAGLVWRPWCLVAFRVDLIRSVFEFAVTHGAILH